MNVESLLDKFKQRSHEIDESYDPIQGQNDIETIYRNACKDLALDSMTYSTCCVCDLICPKRLLLYEPYTDLLVEVIIFHVFF
jgi:hypothetical protein